MMSSSSLGSEYSWSYSGNLSLFYGTLRFVTAFTRAFHSLLSSTRWIQSTPWYYIPSRSFLILSSISGLVYQVISSQVYVCTYHPSEACNLLHLSCSPWSDHPNNTWWWLWIMELLVEEFSKPLITLSFLCSNILNTNFAEFIFYVLPLELRTTFKTLTN
jgi:hypothetical protein